jgi:hypothetical protein
MLKFHSSVITSTGPQFTRIITLEHDDLFTISGPLTKCVPFLTEGTTFEALLKIVGSENSEKLTGFISLLTRARLLEVTSGPADTETYAIGEHSFGPIGDVKIDTIEVQDAYAIVGIKAFREISGLS